MSDRLVFDFHMHSTASDGTYSPREIVDVAVAACAVSIAITDHDTIDGALEASSYASERGLELFTGVELNTDAYGAEIDILGYFWDPSDTKFLDMLKKRQEGRIVRAKKIVEKLESVGVKISYDRVREIAHGAICRPHVIEAMVEKRYVADQKEAFEKYLGLGKPAHVPHDKLTPEEAIDAIHQAGGLPVIAHPGLVENDVVVEKLLRAGAKGLEAYYPMHSQAEIKKYVELAKKYDVIVSCGSDSHGPKRKKSFPIGSMSAPVPVLDTFRKTLRQAYEDYRSGR